MGTTDTDALTERIARALMTHECDQHEDQDECMTCDSSVVTCSHPPFMYCVEHDTTVDVGESCPVALERAAAALPIVAGEVRKAKAEALREAAGSIDLDKIADEWSQGPGNRDDMHWAAGNAASSVVLALRDRATEHEAGDSDDRR